jgi:hypothetical protein
MQKVFHKDQQQMAACALCRKGKHWRCCSVNCLCPHDEWDKEPEELREKA